MADPTAVREILGAAGWHDVDIEPVSTQMTVGETVEAAVDFQLSIGPAGEIVLKAKEQGRPRSVPQIERARDGVEASRDAAGRWRAAARWCVTCASRP